MKKYFIFPAIVLMLLAGTHLAEVRAEDTLEQLRDKIQNGSYNEAGKAITTLRKNGSPDALNILSGLLRGKLDKKRKTKLIAAIAKFKNAEAVAALVAGYPHCTDSNRKYIIGKALSLKACGGEDIIIAGINDREYTTMQKEAVRLSVKLRTPKIEAAMLAQMYSGKQAARVAIVQYLPLTERTKTSEEILAAGLRDKDAFVVAAAVRRVAVLKDIGEAKKLEIIKHVVMHKKSEARKALTEVLMRMNSEPACEQIILMVRNAKEDQVADLLKNLHGKNFPNVVKIATELVYTKKKHIRLAALELIASLPKNKDLRQILITLASSGDGKKDIVLAAIKALRKYKEEDLVFILHGIGKRSKDEDIQAKVVDALIDMPPIYIKNLLIDMYKWAKEDLRFKVIDTMGKLKLRLAARMLVTEIEENLVDDKLQDLEMAEHIAGALRGMGGYKASQGLEIILKSGSEKARINAIRGLVEYQSLPAIKAVGEQLDDSSLDIRCEVIYMLGAAGRKEYVEKISKSLLARKSQERLVAAHALGSIGDRKAVAALTTSPVQKKFRGQRGDYSVLIRIVGKLGGPEATEFLLNLAEGKNPQYAIEALNALIQQGVKGEESAVDRLMALSKAGNDDLHLPAIRVLGYVGGSKVQAALAEMTVKRVGDEASAAAAAMAYTGEASAATELNVLLTSGRYRGSISDVITALIKLGKANPDACVEACKKAYGRAQRNAIAAISWLKDNKVKALLIEEMTDERAETATVVGMIATYGDDKDCRDAVLKMLAKYGPEHVKLIEACAGAQHKDFIKALTLMMLELRDKKYKNARSAIRYALCGITNRDMGDDPEAWRKWWHSAESKTLAKIVEEGFLHYGYEVPAKPTPDGLFICAGLLYEDDRMHFLRINALRILALAADKPIEFIHEKEWNNRIADEWYSWWLINKNALDQKYKN